MAKSFIVEVEVPEGLKAGDTFKVEVEVPTAAKKSRGQLAGLTLAEMTDEQVKREVINANSVLYKAKQRGAKEEIIKANEARAEAARAEKEKRGLGGPAVKPPVVLGSKPVVAGAPEDAEDGGVYDESAAAEI